MKTLDDLGDEWLQEHFEQLPRCDPETGRKITGEWKWKVKHGTGRWNPITCELTKRPEFFAQARISGEDKAITCYPVIIFDPGRLFGKMTKRSFCTLLPPIDSTAWR